MTSSLDPSIGNLINIYPNPSRGLIDIAVPENFNPVKLDLFNMFYQPILSLNLNGNSNIHLDVSQAVGGVYILQLADIDNQVYHHKIQIL